MEILPQPLHVTIFDKQGGLVRLLLFLDGHDEYMLSKIWQDANLASSTGHRSLEEARDLGLVKSRLDNSSYPPRNFISLTPKGKKVAELLKKIEEVLEG